MVPLQGKKAWRGGFSGMSSSTYKGYMCSEEMSSAFTTMVCSCCAGEGAQEPCGCQTPKFKPHIHNNLILSNNFCSLSHGSLIISELLVIHVLLYECFVSCWDIVLFGNDNRGIVCHALWSCACPKHALLTIGA